MKRIVILLVFMFILGCSEMNAIDEIENAWQSTVYNKTESMEREGRWYWLGW